jgi:phosphorylcholine metabolism protein LicD
LGYVRHNDFIPWDDDIDLLVDESILDKFEEILKKYNNINLFFRLSREAVQDLKAYSYDIESHIMSSIIKEFKEEQYTLMSKEDIDLASSQIEYLKVSILRDSKINEILN